MGRKVINGKQGQVRFFRGLVALAFGCGLLLTVGGVVPDKALAAEVLVDGSTY